MCNKKERAKPCRIDKCHPEKRDHLEQRACDDRSEIADLLQDVRHIKKVTSDTTADSAKRTLTIVVEKYCPRKEELM